jgi:hypothetical protein
VDDHVYGHDHENGHVCGHGHVYDHETDHVYGHGHVDDRVYGYGTTTSTATTVGGDLGLGEEPFCSAGQGPIRGVTNWQTDRRQRKRN